MNDLTIDEERIREMWNEVAKGDDLHAITVAFAHALLASPSLPHQAEGREAMEKALDRFERKERGIPQAHMAAALVAELRASLAPHLEGRTEAPAPQEPAQPVDAAWVEKAMELADRYAQEAQFRLGRTRSCREALRRHLSSAITEGKAPAAIEGNLRCVPPGKWKVDMPDGIYCKMPGDPPGPGGVRAVIGGYVYNVQPQSGKLTAATQPMRFTEGKAT